MLQAMNTGHEGSMATIHANTPRDAISRLEQMIGMAGMPMTIASMRGQIAAAVRLIVQLSRLSDGKRKVTYISEITGLEGDILQMQDIYKYVRTGTAADGSRRGPLRRRPACVRASSPSLSARGINHSGRVFRSLGSRCDAPAVDCHALRARHTDTSSSSSRRSRRSCSPRRCTCSASPPRPIASNVNRRLKISKHAARPRGDPDPVAARARP